MSSRVTASLLAWFRARRRDLPWRGTADAYAVWVSEIMLQQTRVEAVVPFYERFLARFPSVRALAAASEEEVLRHWAGLGYYRRARMLHQAASLVCEKLDGALPRRAAELRELPGIGEYTAAAIASIAFGEATPVVDGNVKRVAARFLGLELAADSTALQRAAAEWGSALMKELPGRAEREAGDLNQALMELGATLCTPRAPRCPECPIAGDCAARRAGRAEALPLPARKPATVDLELAFLVAEQDGSFLLRRRRDGWNPGLYEPPSLPSAAPDSLQEEWRRRGESGSIGARLGQVRHTITHHRIRGVIYRLADWRGEALLDPAAVPLTGLGRKVLAVFREAGQAGT